ncbi:MAG: divalent-cation tolerance protein CutA [Planctomycetes bacterium]|nr:divalent-cation tolerance protein CutA [Planctomycetota bacterium]
MKAALTLVTVPDRKTARKLADALVGERLAACVTAVPAAESTYRWKGRVERAREIVLLVKSRASLARRLERRIRELHPYEVPEVLHVPISSGAASYLKWMEESTAI